MEGYRYHGDFLPVLGETASLELPSDENEMRQEHLRLGWLKQEGKLAEAILDADIEDLNLTEDRVIEAQEIAARGKVAAKELVLQNIGLAKQCARVRRAGTCSVEDLFQVAALELVEVVNDYDPRYGTTVSEFGGHRLRRAVTKFISENGFTVRIHESTARFVVDALRAKDSDHPEFALKLLATKYPKRNLKTESDLDAYIEHYHRKGLFAPLELDRPTTGSSASGHNGYAREVEAWTGRAYVEPGETDVFMLLQHVEPRDREIVYMHAVEGRSHREIAADLGISSARVGRIYARGIKRLRIMLQADPTGLAA